MPNQSGPTKQRGCFFYGCLSLAILALVVALFVGVGLYFAKRTVDVWIADYTETSPGKIEELVYPEPKMRELRSRVGAFQQGIEKGGGEAVELVLVADDLNALIAENRELKGKVFVKIEDDEIQGQVSVPLKDIGPLKLKGRYLNGSAAFKLALANGRLDVRLERVTVKDKPLPPMILNELKKQNLAQEAQDDPEASEVFGKIDSIELKEGKVIIRGKPAAAEEKPGAPQP